MDMSIRMIGGFQDTRSNGEDIALTPYLFGVKAKAESIKVTGLGLCWIYFSIYIGVGINVPSNYPSFHVITKNNQTT